MELYSEIRRIWEWVSLLSFLPAFLPPAPPSFIPFLLSKSIFWAPTIINWGFSSKWNRVMALMKQTFQCRKTGNKQMNKEYITWWCMLQRKRKQDRGIGYAGGTGLRGRVIREDIWDKMTLDIWSEGIAGGIPEVLRWEHVRHVCSKTSRLTWPLLRREGWRWSWRGGWSWRALYAIVGILTLTLRNIERQWVILSREVTWSDLF